MDLLLILLNISELILIIVFIILGIKLIFLIDNMSKVITDVEKGIKKYKNELSPVFKAVDCFSYIASKSNFLVKKIFKKSKNRNEE